MGIGSNTLDYVRNFFREPDYKRPPVVPVVGYAGFTTASPYFNYSMTAASLGGIGDYLRIDSDLVSRYVDYEDQDESPLVASAIDIYCLSGDTKVPLLDGRCLPIKEIAEKFEDNMWVYSSDGKKIVPARIKSAQKTGSDQKVLEVTLDDGSVIKTTPDHKFMMRDGSFVMAKDMVEGTSLMPLYRKVDKKGYEWTYDGDQFVLTHRISFLGHNGYLPENNHGNDPKHLKIIHHKDFRKTKGKILGCKYRVLDRRVSDAGFKNWSDFKENVLGITPKHNHKVVSVKECLEKHDVYDLTIEGKNHCFAAGDGNGFVIVHNSDDASQLDSQENKSVWVTSPDEYVRKELDEMFHKRLRIEENVWQHIRTLVKYGNNFSEIVAQEKAGVLALNSLPPPTMRRIEIPRQVGQAFQISEKLQDTLGFIFDPRGLFKMSTRSFVEELAYRSNPASAIGQELKRAHEADGSTVLESWEVMHMRMLGKSPYSIYGFGIGEPARWVFKRLLMLEDSIILHRLTRSPSRYAFYIDVSGVPPNETNAYLTKVKQALKKQKFVNPSSGKQDQKYSVLSSDDDFFLPSRDGKESTRVENLAGPIYDHIEDIRFFENKLFAALKVPKPFLTYEETTAKTHLSAEDARFARTILRVQREVKNGLNKVGRVHLAAKGINPDSVKFDINMSVPSAIFELAQLEIKSAELELADKFSAWAPKEWIMHHVLGFSDEQISEMDDIKRREEEEGEAPVEHSGGSSGALEKALSKRGERNRPETETASVSYKGRPIVQERVKRNTSALMDRIAEMREKDKGFDRHWSDRVGFLKELQDSMKHKNK